MHKVSRIDSSSTIKNETNLINQIEIQEIDRKVGKIGYQIFKSHLAHLALKIVFLVGFSILTVNAAVITSAVPVVIPITISVFLTLLIIINTIYNYKKLLFDISFIYTVKTGGHDWWTPISDQIILGAIPLESHSERLKKNKVTHILTLLEPFELATGLITPIHKKTLENSQIKNKIIPCQDFKGVSTERIHQAVDYMHECMIQKNHRIYVHCKAGRGRSASVVVAYLLKHGSEGKKFKDFKEAYAFVKSKRPQVNLNPGQQKTIEDYYSTYLKLDL